MVKISTIIISAATAGAGANPMSRADGVPSTITVFNNCQDDFNMWVFDFRSSEQMPPTVIKKGTYAQGGSMQDDSVLYHFSASTTGAAGNSTFQLASAFTSSETDFSMAAHVYNVYGTFDANVALTGAGSIQCKDGTSGAFLVNDGPKKEFDETIGCKTPDGNVMMKEAEGEVGVGLCVEGNQFKFQNGVLMYNGKVVIKN